jgi:hypothetical protein
MITRVAANEVTPLVITVGHQANAILFVAVITGLVPSPVSEIRAQEFPSGLPDPCSVFINIISGGPNIFTGVINS